MLVGRIFVVNPFFFLATSYSRRQKRDENYQRLKPPNSGILRSRLSFCRVHSEFPFGGDFDNCEASAFQSMGGPCLAATLRHHRLNPSHSSLQTWPDRIIKAPGFPRFDISGAPKISAEMRTSAKRSQ